jgi:hypothetical protein
MVVLVMAICIGCGASQCGRDDAFHVGVSALILISVFEAC